MILFALILMLMTNVRMLAQQNKETNTTQTRTNSTQQTQNLTNRTKTVDNTSATSAKKNTDVASEKQEKATKETNESQILAKPNEQKSQQDAFEEKAKELAKEEVDLVLNDMESLKMKLLITEIIAGLAIVLAFCAIILFFIEKNKFRENLLSELDDCHAGGRMDNFVSRVAEKAKSNSSSSSSYSSIDYRPAKIDQGELKSMIDDYLSTKIEEEKEQQEIKLEEQRIFQQNQPKKLFADSIVENHFNKITEYVDDDTVFELYLGKGTDFKAEFTIYENAKRRVLKNADFIDGCDKQKINSNPIDLQIEKGVAILQDGKWQISQKAKVKFV